MNLNSSKIIEKTIEKYVLPTLKPKIPQRLETFCRCIFTFLDPTGYSYCAKTLKNWWKNINTQKSYAKKTGCSDTF
jgi:hypothetical protein